jgi:hypothetical protein
VTRPVGDPVCDENEKHPLLKDRHRKLTKLILDMDSSVTGQSVQGSTSYQLVTTFLGSQVV